MMQDANAFVANISQAARDNPLAVALIGGGALWLMLGNRPIGAAFGSVATGAQSAARAASNVAEAMTTAGQAAANDIAETARSTMRAAGDAARTGSSVARDRLNDAFSRTADTASDATHLIQSNAAADRPSRSASRLQESYANAQSTLTDLFERQPLILGVLGVAIGAGVASAVSSTDIENEWAGSLSDEVKEAARSRADHVTATVQRAASEFGSDFRAAASEAADTLRNTGEEAARAMREKVDAERE